jgi:hypothetical protein
VLPLPAPNSNLGRLVPSPLTRGRCGSDRVGAIFGRSRSGRSSDRCIFCRRAGLQPGSFSSTATPVYSQARRGLCVVLATPRSGLDTTLLQRLLLQNFPHNFFRPLLILRQNK